MDQKILESLEKHNIKYQDFEHDAVFTVEQAKKIEDTIPGIHTKNLFLKDKKNNFFLVTLEANKRLDIKTFGKENFLKELSFGNENQLFEVLRVLPGSVNLFSSIHGNEGKENLKVFIDKDLWNKPAVGWHPGANTHTFVVDFENLEKFLKLENIDFEVVSIPEK